MAENQGSSFDPVALRARLADRDEGYAAFLIDPLYADEAAALMPGLAEWHAYRSLPSDAQKPSGLNAGDFARAYCAIRHPAGILSKARGEGPNDRVDDLHLPDHVSTRVRLRTRNRF